MLYFLKGKFQLFLFMVRSRSWYVVSILGIVIGVIGTVVESPVSMAGIILVVASTFLGLVLFLKDTVEIRRSEKDLFILSLSMDWLKSLHPLGRLGNYQRIDLRDWHAMYSTEVNRLIGSNNLEFDLDKVRFQINPVAKALAPLALRSAFKTGKVLFNSTKIRLKSDLEPATMQAGKRLTLQRTDYFSGLCTNEMTSKEVWSKSTNSRLFDGTSFMINNRILLDLEESKCSNHIGVSTLAFTRGGNMVITIQSQESAQSASLLAPSGSGSADWADIHAGSTDFQQLVTRAMERELLEECGLKDHSITQVRTRLIGYARLLHRGGKPEFFGVSFLDVPFSALTVSGKESIFIANIVDIRIDQTRVQEFRSALKRFQKENLGRFSFLLYLQMKFLTDLLETSPGYLFDLINPPPGKDIPPARS